jgi:hypothetical protein
MEPKTIIDKDKKLALDFKHPLPFSLADPDRLTARLEKLTSYYTWRLELSKMCLGMLPHHLPEETRAYMRPFLEARIDDLCLTMRRLQGEMALVQPVESTEFGRCRAIIPASPKLLLLKDQLLKLTRYAAEFPNSSWPQGKACVGPDETTFGMFKVPGDYPLVDSNVTEDQILSFRTATIGEMEAAGRSLDRVEGLFGSFDIWVKRPKLETCHAMVRAWQNGDLDSEEFLFWFRKDNLGLLGPQLDPYIAQILLGMRKEAGELVLPGDMTVVRKRRQTHLDNIPEEEFCGRLVKAARSRKRWQESVKVGRENERADESEVENLVNLLPIDSWDDLRRETAIGLAFIRHAERHDAERIGRAAGLTKKESRLLYQQFKGVGSRSDDPSAWDAVYRKRHEIRDAIVSDPKAAFPAPITSPNTVFREILPNGHWIYSHTANRHLEFDLG